MRNLSYVLAAVFLISTGCGRVGGNSTLPAQSPARANGAISSPDGIGHAQPRRSGHTLARTSFTESVLYSFGGLGSGDGQLPDSRLIVGKGGVLYGTTEKGGEYSGNPNCYDGGCGTVYALTPNGQGYSESVVYDFQGGNDGTGPYALTRKGTSLVGVTAEGGNAPNCGLSCGTVFELSPAGSGFVERLLYVFQGPPDDGYAPEGALVADKHGALYGTTYYSGSGTCAGYYYNCGTVFKLTPHGKTYTESVIHTFAGSPSDGQSPAAGLLLEPDGTLYGTTYGGGSGPCSRPGVAIVGCGTVFKLTPAGSGYIESLVHDFAGPPYDGAYPSGSLTRKGTQLFGTTFLGGTAGYGSVYSLTPSGPGFTETLLHSFQGGPGDGEEPIGRLVLKNGALFGTTSLGGSGCYPGECGIVFKVPLEGAYSILYNFRGGTYDGEQPDAGLIADAHGALYGTTGAGGPANAGTFFKLTP